MTSWPVAPLDARLFVWPTTGTIRSFGFRRYRRPDGTWHYHQGVDFPAPEGAPVYAVDDGVVVHAHGGNGPLRGFSGYGRLVVLRHAGRWTLYAHLKETNVERGAEVLAGQVIGFVGRTCFSREAPAHLCAGSHLHFEVATSPYPKARDTHPADRGRINPRELYQR